MQTERDNVLFIVADSMRSDALGVNGNLVCRTPHLDELAADGTSFRRCFAQSPVCAPSRAAIMTGWYPHVRGHRTFTYHIRPDEENLLKYFKRDDYLVKAAGTNDCLHEDCFPDSIDEWMESQGASMDGASGDLSEDPDMRRAFLSGRLSDEFKHDRNWHIKENAISFLRKEAKNPWFFYCALHLPHPKYGAPEPWCSMYDPDDMPDPIACDYEGQHAYMKIWHELSRMGRLDPRTIKRIRALYYGMVSLTDQYVGEIVAALKARGEYEQTTIIFASDHGDYTGDYGLPEKGECGTQDCLLNVPLIIKPAAGGAAQRGAVDTRLCELIDILPTLLEMNDIDAAHNHYGVSLLRLLRGEDRPHKEAVFFEGGYSPEDRFAMINVLLRDWFEKCPDTPYAPREMHVAAHPELLDRFACVRTEKLKYVQRGTGSDALYDLVNDPHETRNLIGSEVYADQALEMQGLLLGWYLRTSDSVSHTIDDRLCAAAWDPKRGLRK